MEIMKLITGFALIAALLTHHLSLNAGAFNDSSAAGGGLSLGLIANHDEGSIYSTRRGSDGFLYLRRRQDDSRLLLSSAASVIAPEANGGAVVVLRVGTGAAQHEYTLKADATSRLTWIQCAPCVPHAPQSGPIFDPTASPTFRLVAGASSICVPQYGMEPAGDRCAFHVAGPGGMSVHGYVHLEHVVDQHSRSPFESFVLGCSHSTEHFQSHGQYAGVATVSRAPASLASQLAKRGMARFSYCLAGAGGGRRQGFLRFGADVPHNNPRYQTTSILPPAAALGDDTAAYYVGLVGVSLGAKRLEGIRPEMFARGRDDGNGGCVIDLGTRVRVTVMAEEAYRVVEEAVWSELVQLGHGAAVRVEQRGGYGLCVRVTEQIKGRLQSQSLSLHFDAAEKEEATMVVKPAQLYLMMDDDEQAGRQVACLAMVPGRRTIIGALQQVDSRFVFDLEGAKLSFAPESCIEDTVQVV
ncbi:unnamed protein product [Urochloa decumbens]|uniref:Peptidase A1 domain-containing protein n=1 Tax=Urochloa decumbens TaxID=240449 RepID=A0ABC9D9W8_9POAL